MNYIVFSHLGLGDQIIMNGFIHYLLKTENVKNINIIAYNNYQKGTLEHLYSDLSNVSMRWIDQVSGLNHPNIQALQGLPFRTLLDDGKTRYILCNFGIHSQFRTCFSPNSSWADTLYLQASLNPDIRFEHFTLPSNMSSSLELYNKIIKEIGKSYIIINDDPKRLRNMNQKLIKSILRKSNHESLPILYLGINRYQYPLFEGFYNPDMCKYLACESILDYWDILKNAEACHLMDSSIACMTDIIKGSNTDLHLHDYITGTVDRQFPIFRNRKWKIWFKDNEDESL